jgi:hypothetical protein
MVFNGAYFEQGLTRRCCKTALLTPGKLSPLSDVLGRAKDLHSGDPLLRMCQNFQEMC